MRQGPFVHAVASVTIAVALFSADLARFGVVGLSQVLGSWSREVELTLYLKGQVTPEQANLLAERLRREDGAEAKVVSPEEALDRLRRDLGEAGAVLASLPKNPLPASLEARPAPGQRSAAAVASLAERWAKLAEVESVEYGRQWLERLEDLARGAKAAGALMLLVVLVAATVVVAATLQLAIYTRREEIEIQKLVGATNAFVKAPFLIEGAAQGLAGAALAWTALFCFGHYFGPRFSQGLELVTRSVSLPPLVDARAALELGATGMGLGLAGSLFAVRRFLKG
jgi:cell division transport system permease protein